jgi:hypothetical protein
VKFQVDGDTNNVYNKSTQITVECRTKGSASIAMRIPCIDRIFKHQLKCDEKIVFFNRHKKLLIVKYEILRK